MSRHTGRERTRWICPGCDQRIYLGEPKAIGSWAQRLHLSREQYDLLLMAAAEYRDLSDAAGEYESVVSFVEWVSVDALKAA